MGNFRKLKVWDAARSLAKSVYQLAKPMTCWALRDQMLRAAISVPANIVEGSEHTSRREFVRFLRYSLASASEVEGHAQLAVDFGEMQQEDFDQLNGQIAEVRKMFARTNQGAGLAVFPVCNSGL